MSADLHSGDTGGGRLGGSALHANADKISAAKLDLRAPADLVAASTVSGERPEFAADGQAFPSVRGASDDSPRARLEEHLRSLGAEGAAVHPMSRAEQLATRFRREGLPVARLFESHSALISLGLNQRGKPGIWLIQKLP